MRPLPSFKDPCAPLAEKKNIFLRKQTKFVIYQRNKIETEHPLKKKTYLFQNMLTHNITTYGAENCTFTINVKSEIKAAEIRPYRKRMNKTGRDRAKNE